MNVSNMIICFVQGEIDAREDSFRSAMESGNKLVDTNHYAADEVREKVSDDLNYPFDRLLNYLIFCSSTNG
jgi:hypothetical protein